MPIKTKDYNENNANGDKREERINEGSGEDKTKDNSKIQFNEKDIEEFKSVITRVYKEDLKEYSAIIKDYGKEFKVPELYFDLNNLQKTGFKLIDDLELNSKILASYYFKSNEITIKPELLASYLNSNKDSNILEHTLAHELGHAIAMQFDLTKNVNDDSKKSIYGTITDELLANLFAAESRVKKKGMPLSNEAVAKQLIKDNVDLNLLSNDIDAAKIYLKSLRDYSNNTLPSVKKFSDNMHDKLLDISQNRGIIIGYENIEKINKLYFEGVNLQLKNYMVNALANYTILIYAAPLLGAAKALLSEKMPFKQFIDKVSDNVSSIKEIKRYLKGSFASLNLRLLSAIESDIIEVKSKGLLIDKLNEGNFKNYPEAFSKMANGVEDEFKQLNIYLNMEIESEKKLLRDLSRLEKSLRIRNN